MSVRLKLYGANAKHEVELPTIDLGSWNFTLEKGLFGLSRDYCIRTTVLDNKWCFAVATGEYAVMRGNDSHFERYVRMGEALTIKLPNSDGDIVAIACEMPDAVDGAAKYVLDKRNPNLTVGSSPDCSIAIGGVPMIADVHARFSMKEDGVGKGWCLHPNHLCYVNGVPVSDERKLEFGDVIDFYGPQMVFLDEIIAVCKPTYPGASVQAALQVADKKTLKWLSNLSVMSDGDKQDGFYRPAPRALAEYDSEELEIEGPPAPQKLKERSFISVIGPSLTMALPMVVGVALTGMGSGIAGLIMMVGSAIGMAIWGAKSLHDQKKEAKEEEARRQEKYRAYLKRREGELAQTEEYNKAELRRMYPTAAECLGYSISDGLLWGRNRKQPDYNVVRLGIGEADTLRPVKIPPDKFTLVEDELIEEPKRIKARFEKMRDVPLGIDLSRFGMFGIIGGESLSGCYPVARTILAEVAANFRYSDVKIVLLCNGRRAEDRRLLESVKWLPHMWSDDNSIRYAGDTPETAKEVLNELTPLLKERWDEARGNAKAIFDTRYVLVCTDESLLADSLAAVYLMDGTVDLETNVFLFAERQNDLPNACECMIQNTPEFAGSYTVSDARKNWRPIQFDQVSYEALGTFAHAVAGVKIQTPDMQREIPDAITFLGMYGVESVKELNVYERWRTSRSFNELSAPIGVAADDMICSLDIHERAHGPHGLVAGTTGSGKSETLMTWVLSLAVNYSPEDVSFLLVDFKGGGLANQFDNPRGRLPHLAGTITNLGGNQIQRALVSIKSENERRQRLLADAGANDVYDYAKMYKNGEVDRPLPHLVIAVDEFAELKKQFPDFMAELVSVAAIGRSLGVHLVLATQKPSGVVDDKISSNSRFRLCLKVQTPQDSKDMLQRADAAYITQKGRGILRVGNDELFEMFQSAWSRAPYPADPLASHADVARLITVTGRTRMTGTHHLAVKRGQEAAAWMQGLVETAKSVLKDAGVTPKAYLADARSARKANERFYAAFNKRGWGIQQSEGNDERIANLVRVYDLCTSQSAEREAAPTKLGELAQSMGLALPEKAARTQLDSVVEELAEVARNHDLTLRDTLWLPELPEYLPMEAVGKSGLPEGYMEGKMKGDGWSLETCIGLLDDPEHQYQAPVFVDFATGGNLAIFGAAMTGKSTLLQGLLFTLMRRYTPDELNVYCIDCSGRKLDFLRDAPHVGGILFEEDSDPISKLFFLLNGLLAERKKSLHGMSFAQLAGTSQDSVPAVVLAIDNYGSFQEKTDGAYDKDMLALAKEGPSHGIYLALTGGGIGMGEVPSKLADTIKGRVCLEMNNAYDYREMLNVTRGEVVPCEGVPGRGLVVRNGVALEFQVAIPANEDDDKLASEKIRRACKRMAMAWEGATARKVPTIPAEPKLSEYLKLQEVRDMFADDRSLPIGYDRISAQPTAIDLSRVFCFAVSGKERSGRRNFMALLVEMAARKKGDIYVFGKGAGPLRQAAGRCGATYYSDERGYELFFEAFGAELLRRNKKKHALELSGLDESEIYLEMQDARRVFVFIEDLPEFTERLYSPSADAHDVSHFFEVFSEKAWFHQVFLFAGIDQGAATSARGTTFYSRVLRDKTGAHFGGNVSAQQLLRFDYIKGFSAQSKIEGPTVALIATSDIYPDGGGVVVPEVDLAQAGAGNDPDEQPGIVAQEVPDA